VTEAVVKENSDYPAEHLINPYFPDPATGPCNNLHPQHLFSTQ
jgi:hypothetical protein